MPQEIRQPGGTGSSPPTVTVTPPAAQDTLDPAQWSVTVTVDGSPVVPSAISWSTPTGTSWDDDEIATPTMTPTAAGVVTAVCTVTVNGIDYVGAASWVLGDGSQLFNPVTLSVDMIDVD